MARAWIGLGSNLGDSRQTLLAAWRQLGGLKEIKAVRLSSLYQSKPVDMDSDNWFVNAVGELTTSLSPEKLLGQLLTIEHTFGRRRDPALAGHQDRTLDLDLLLYDDLILKTARLELPHPRLHKRLFVLAPLAELAPDLVHPVRLRRMEELHRHLLNTTRNDRSQTIRKLPEGPR
jgi:2-amino-4-hydroxy-6-hydroxymethyldihydropteridine diphosphokinase